MKRTFWKNNGHQILISDLKVSSFFANKQYFLKLFLNEKPPDELHSQSGGKDNFKILWVYFIITNTVPEFKKNY